MVTLSDLKTPKENTWCPGCGNFGILMAFKKALIELNAKRENIVIVSGIGCHGKIVNYVNVNGFHGLHGRVIPTLQGIKLANPKLTLFGFAGDADQYNEGWGHFAHAIRQNLDVTLIVHNNMVRINYWSSNIYKPTRIYFKINSIWSNTSNVKSYCSCSSKQC